MSSPDPSAVARFFSAVESSPGREGIMLDINAHHYLRDLLKKVENRNDPDSIPNPSDVSNLLRRTVEYREGMAIGSRDYNQ